MSSSTHPTVLPRRPYGRTGRQLSVIGMGGIVVTNTEPDEADRLVAEAVERGVNYFDVAPTYGNAEQRLGPALEPYRNGVFLACKTGKRTRDEAAAELAASLKTLRTDHFDLYQLHGLTHMDKDVDVAFSRGGAIEALAEAKRSGQVRYLGFSAHTEEAALAAMDRFDFDSVLFPFNFACWLAKGFGPRVLAAAEQKGIARLALKALARQRWPESHPERQTYRKCWYQPLTNRETAGLALRFTLNQPITAAVSPGEASLFRLALDLAADLRPLDDTELTRLKTLAGSLAPIFPQS